jgi:hypothetical protein
MAQFTAVANILLSAERGDGNKGIYHAPETSEVIYPVDFGAISSEHGTFVVPAEADVKDGVNYGVET